MFSTSPNEDETLLPTPTFRPASARRTASFSSSEYSSDSSLGSSSFSLNEDQFPLFTPGTPLKYRGIPFSWEKIPGIPKHPLGLSTKPEYSSGSHLLPLPPAGNTTSATSTTKKTLHQEEISPKKSNRFQKDPFFAALVECSKEDHDHDDHSANNNSNISWKGSSKITRSLSDRFGFINMYTSCKKTCTVAESIVYLPRPTPHYLLHRRSS